MKNLLQAIVKMLFIVGAIFSAFRYLADFSFKQSGVLTVIAFLFYLMRVAPREAKPPFVPYGIFVKPNFPAILADLELVKNTKEDWARVRAEIEKVPKEQWNIWDSGFSLSFVRPGLIYNKASNSFATEVNLYASLDPIVTLREGQKVDENPIIKPFSPSLELRQGNYGYRLRVTLLGWYWDRVKNKEMFKGFDVDGDEMSGTVDVLLAVIPYEEFGIYFVSEPGASVEAYNDAIGRRAEARSRYGWKGKPKSDSYGNETGADRSNTIEHRYFNMSHWDL